ncbi:hypothetical protein [Mesorhizobium sp. LjRoot246]|uniref:hypothetical protein n=1 Tax=Mesorhizobium sp. LjRoot246 TaxID=3342294 RepID=UPI003ECEE9C9
MVDPFVELATEIAKECGEGQHESEPLCPLRDAWVNFALDFAQKRKGQRGFPCCPS